MDQGITPQQVGHDRQDNPQSTKYGHGHNPGIGATEPQNLTEESPKGVSGSTTGSAAHGIFDERFRLFTDAFGNTCEQEGARTAIAIVVDPKLPTPIVFMRGSEYDVAKLVATLLRHLQQEVLSNIST